jgi:uncharacterized protein
MRLLRRLALVALVMFAVVLGLAGCVQRRLLFFPTHAPVARAVQQLGLTPWFVQGEYTGYARLVENPRKIWLFLHGNGVQAGNRGYVLERIGRRDSVYILEYPGYGERAGKPSKASFDRAALTAYEALVAQHGVENLIVLGESLGSGPACELARASTPPRHIVLVVPFDVLKDIAQEKFRFLPVGLIMLDRWNNVEALKGFTGRLDVFGAKYDNVIPVHHARKLAASVPGAIYREFPGDHGWASGPHVVLSEL